MSKELTVEPSSKERTAYGCFGFCGLATLVVLPLGVWADSMSTGGATLLALVIVVPLVMASIGVGVTGIVLSLIVRRGRLLLLSAMTIGVLFVLFSLLFTNYDPQESLYIYSPIIYGVVVTGITAYWFWSVR